MEKTRKHRSDILITISMVALLLIGLLIIYVLSPLRANVVNAAYKSGVEPMHFFTKQLFSVAMALVAFLVAFKVIPYKFLQKFSKLAIIVGIGLSVLLWILALAGSSLAKCELGECRWFNLGFITFQPADVLKICLAIYLAGFLAQKKADDLIGDIKEFWMPLGIVMAISLFLVVVAQGDLGSGVSLMVIFLSMIFAAGVPLKQFFIVLGLIVAAAVVLIMSSSVRMARVNTWWSVLTGSGESTDSTYHIDNALLAIGSGGFWGVGMGNSVQATGYLPESINDSIFAIMGEIFGFVGLVGIIGLFALLLFRIAKTAEYTADVEKRMAVIGIFGWIAAQIIVNIMAMTGLIPVTGITLPLISYGGTSMVFVSFGIGIVAQLSCYTGREVKNEDISSRRGIRGTRNSGSSRRS